MNDDYRLWPSPAQRLFERVWIQIPRCALAIQEDGTTPQVGNWVGAGHECERGTQDLVARAHAAEPQSQMQGGGTRTKRDRWNTDFFREISLEGGKIRTYAGQPIRSKSFHNKWLFEATHMGCGQINAGHRYQLGVVVNVTVRSAGDCSTAAPLGVLRAPRAAFTATKTVRRTVLGELRDEGKQKARAPASGGALLGCGEFRPKLAVAPKRTRG
jgi:hypothetical protein